MWLPVAVVVMVLTLFQTSKGCRSGLRSGTRYVSGKFNSLKMSVGQVPTKVLQVVDTDTTLRNVHYFDSGYGATTSLPPLLIIGGTAQTIDTFSPHINQIAKTRRLIIPELRGQGRTELDPTKCSLAQLTNDLHSILDVLDVRSADLAGFSFGGRVAMAFAAHNSALVRKLSTTAIPLTRPALGRIVLESWMDGLKRGNMRECAWSFIINGYSDAFLERNAERLALYVDMVATSNDPQKVYNLIYHSGKGGEDDPYSVSQCVDKIKCPTLVIGATQDRIAGVEPVRQLARRIAGSEYVEMNTGHLAPFEEPLVWRKHLLDFMNKPL
jgi:3-oxoadipate enol-lactonase